MSDVRNILESMGYSLMDAGNHFRTKPLYRDSGSSNVLSIKQDTGYWYDFKTGDHGSLDRLVSLTLDLNTDASKQYLTERNWSFDKIGGKKEKLKEQKIFPIEMLDKLEQCHDYWIARGVSEKTLKTFRGGVAYEGRMKDRYVFPIFNYKGQVVGFSGRDLINNPENNMRPKWKHFSGKGDWVYPLYFNSKLILKEKKVILVESIGDMLALWNEGYKNTLVTFGLELNQTLLNILIKIDPTDIYVSLNNDQNQAGNVAAQKMTNKLSKFFDNKQLNLTLPDSNDFGAMSPREIQSWADLYIN